MKLKHLFCIALSVVSTLSVRADNCDVHLMILPCEQGEDIPYGSNDFLMTRLGQAVTATGVTADNSSDRFFITGKFNHVTETAVAGPPAQTALHTVLTLYIGDIANKKVFASKQFELRGVGTSEQRAFINAFHALNAKNAELQKFVNLGKNKIVEYYDTHASQLLAKAERAAAMHHYDEALSIIAAIPECCKDYNRVKPYVLRYFKNYIDLDGQKMLNKARAEWAAQPNAAGASRALKYLLEIDPESSAYQGAEALLKEMKTSVADDRHFELRTKYADNLDLEKRRIEGARAVGVAFGNGQQPVTTNITWLR